MSGVGGRGELAADVVMLQSRKQTPAHAEPVEACAPTERRVKGWSRAKKEALIAGDWARLRKLLRKLLGKLSRNRQG